VQALRIQTQTAEEKYQLCPGGGQQTQSEGHGGGVPCFFAPARIPDFRRNQYTSAVRTMRREAA
jgi:hypothetical protein